jgi:hypothetical protein
MQTTSNLYKTILAGEHSAEVKLTVYSANGRTMIGDFGMNKLIQMSTERGLMAENGFGVGNCVSGKIRVSFYPTDENGNAVTIPKMAMLLPKYRVVNETQHSEWISKGRFYVDTRIENGSNGSLYLEGFDAMLKAEEDFPLDGSDTYPMSDTVALQKIAYHIGVQIDTRTNSIVNGTYTVPMPLNYSCREVLSAIGVSYGANFCISDVGKLLAVLVENVQQS